MTVIFFVSPLFINNVSPLAFACSPVLVLSALELSPVGLRLFRTVLMLGPARFRLCRYTITNFCGASTVKSSNSVSAIY